MAHHQRVIVFFLHSNNARCIDDTQVTFRELPMNPERISVHDGELLGSTHLRLKVKDHDGSTSPQPQPEASDSSLGEMEASDASLSEKWKCGVQKCMGEARA